MTNNMPVQVRAALTPEGVIDQRVHCKLKGMFINYLWG